MKNKNPIGVMSHPLRRQIVEILSRSPETVGTIVAITGRSQPDISSHMAILSKANIVESFPKGRHKLYRLIPEEFEDLANWVDTILHNENPPDPPPGIRKLPAMEELHYARTCYDHLAGVQGVDMLDELFIKRWIKPRQEMERQLVLTDDGEDALQSLGVKIPPRKNNRRMFAYLCKDWTVKRYHMGGALGFSLMKSLEGYGYVQRIPGSRKVIVNKEVKFFLGGEHISLNHKRV